MPARVVIGHRSDLVITGMSRIFEASGQADVIAAATTTDDLLVTINTAHLDVVILDERLDPATDVFGVIYRLRCAAVNLPLIVIGSVNTGLYIRDLLAYGVRGYLYECDPLQNSLITAIEMVLRGHTFLSLTANAEYLVAMRSRGRDWKLDAESRHVLQLLASGRHVNQIAEQMNLTVGRVYEIRRKLRRRFNVDTNEHLMLRAIEEGFNFPDG